jgi:diaminopimelate epimerase
MKKVLFHKMSGAGNDFVLIDKKINPGFSLNVDQIVKICDRRFGIGADGILTIGENPNYDFTMEYFNADGSSGSLCGNGARCALKYSSDHGWFDKSFAVFECNNEKYKGEIIKDDQIKFYLNEPAKLELDLQISTYNQIIQGSFVDNGSPHFVIEAIDILKNSNDSQSYFEDLNEIPVIEMGREIRNNEKFRGGTNVNFISLQKDMVSIRTYERGVEDETLACGTGSVASALIVHLKHKTKPPIHLLTRSTDILIVDFEFHNNKFSNISLTGPANTIFTGQINL